MFNVPRALKIVNELHLYVQEVQDTMPEMMPLVQQVLSPLMGVSSNGGGRSEPTFGGKKRIISEATRAKMRAAAAKRWGKKSQRRTT